MILIIDNFDSFVYNLARYVRELGYACLVKRNNTITLADIQLLNPSHIIISPGPCTPNEAGISLAVIKHFGPSVPLLGVCLGHQAIGQAYGATITRAIKPMHGKSALITHNQTGIFNNIENPLQVARYHSLIVQPDAPTSSNLIYTAFSQEGEVMALTHSTHPVVGVQFHPESILTPSGYALLENFLKKI